MFSRVYKWKRENWLAFILVTKVDTNSTYTRRVIFFINCILCEIEYVNLIKKFISNIATKYFSIQTWEVAGFDCDM